MGVPAGIRVARVGSAAGCGRRGGCERRRVPTCGAAVVSGSERDARVCRMGGAGVGGVRRCESESQASREGYGLRRARNPVHTQVSYTSAEYVTFSDQELVHLLEVDVNASAVACYELCNELGSLQNCLSIFRDFEEVPEEPDAAAITLMYRYAKLPPLELKFVGTRVEDVPGESLAWVSQVGMPIAGLVDFEETAENSTKVKLRVVYCMPKPLSLFEEAASIRGNVDFLLREALAKLKALAEAGL